MRQKTNELNIRNIELAPSGFQKIKWVKKRMPILNTIEEQFKNEKPFIGKNIAMSIHLEAKTAYMALIFQNGGANVSITGSNLLTTQDDCAAALMKSGINVHAWHNATVEEYVTHLNRVLDPKPDLILDDGANLTSLIHDKRRELIPKILGGSEETTGGVARIQAMEHEGILEFPMIAVNNALMKHLFDNRYGTGQSSLEAIMHATNQTICGKNIVVIEGTQGDSSFVSYMWKHNLSGRTIKLFPSIATQKNCPPVSLCPCVPWLNLTIACPYPCPYLEIFSSYSP